MMLRGKIRFNKKVEPKEINIGKICFEFKKSKPIFKDIPFNEVIKNINKIVESK